MKVLNFVKNMTKKQKIIVGISMSSILVVIVILTIVIITKNNQETENVFSEYGKISIMQEKEKTEEDTLLQDSEEDVLLQDSEEVSEEQLEEEKVRPEEIKTGKAAYYVKVNYGANTVTVYGKDNDGNYTIPVKTMICSCGISTPKSGVYKTSEGYRWGTLIGGVYGQYSTRIVGNILFHSVPYTAQSPDSLEYWEFDKLGTKASAGCVRLMVEDARWIYNNCRGGTMVEFYTSDDPGPLGKPSAPKISGNERCRGWDPTDPVDGNPWREEIVQEEIVEEQTVEQITEQSILVENTDSQQSNVPNVAQNQKNLTNMPVNNAVIPKNNVVPQTPNQQDLPNNTVDNTSEDNNEEEHINQEIPVEEPGNLENPEEIISEPISEPSEEPNTDLESNSENINETE